ncbi:MAG: (2Fe-2S)-binding protein [Desulfobacteraceae bacterium]|jgi:aerobic-type carbon monoxide dehydrogenase small subunit (CoxS/CutS family)
MTEKKDNKTEAERKKGFGDLSRREFLKDTGLVIGGTTVGSIAFSSEAEAQKQPETSEAAEARSLCDEEKNTIDLTVNGGKYRFRVEPNWSLRQLLRDEIGLTSPKDWCGGLGACGSCTVIMNGRPVLSCLTLAVECDGARIETAEGIAKSGHPIIQSYIKWNAFQCGYCTPGFVTSAKALLDRNPNPTEADVRDALGGNLCRCATYQQHPKAVLDAAEELKRA